MPGLGPSAAGESSYPETSSWYVNLLGTVSPSLTLEKETLFFGPAAYEGEAAVSVAATAAADVPRNSRRELRRVTAVWRCTRALVPWPPSE